MGYKFKNIRVIDFIKTISILKGSSLRKLISRLAQSKNYSNCYSGFYNKLKNETIKFTEVADIADELGYEIVFHEIEN